MLFRSSDTLGRALVSSSGNLYLRLIREDGGGRLYGPLSPVNGRVQIADVEPGDYIDILVVHTTRNIDTAFKELTFGKEWTRNDIESSLAEVIDGYASIGWTGERTLKHGPNNLGNLTLRPLCDDSTIDLESEEFLIEPDTPLPRFYQLDFENQDIANIDYFLNVPAAGGLTFEIGRASCRERV